MRRGVAIAAVVAAAVLALWWLRRDDRAPAARGASPDRDRPADRVVVPGAPDAAVVVVRSADAAPPAIDAGTKEAMTPEPAILPLAEVSADGEARAARAARGCADDGAVTVQYVLVVAGGQARIDDVRAVQSDLDPDVEDCAIGAIEALSWEARGAGDARLGVQAAIRLAE